jgi:hypothetical protein
MGLIDPFFGDFIVARAAACDRKLTEARDRRKEQRERRPRGCERGSGDGNAAAHLPRLQRQCVKSKALPNNFNALTILTRQSKFPFHAESKHFFK